MRFDWDDAKAESNVAKHGVGFEEAMTVFDDDHAAIRDDPDHSIGEHREIIVGRSDTERILLVSFAERGDVIRLSTPERQLRANANSMKKNSAKKSDEDELRPQYGPEFFRNMKPNRFATRPKLGRIHGSRSTAKRVKKRDS